MTHTTHRAVATYRAAFAALGAVALALAWWIDPVHGEPDLLLLGAAFAALICIGDRTELNFRVGPETLAATSATVPLLVAALYLPPVIAGAAAALSYLAVELRRDQVLAALYGAGSTAVALMAASATARAFVGGEAPSPQLAILAGAIAAVTFEVLYTGAGMGLLELRRRGAAREFLPAARPVIVFDVVLGIVGVTVVAPFGAQPLLLVGVLVAFQLVAHAVLGTVEREQVHRSRADLLQSTFSRYVPATVVQQLIDDDVHVPLGGESRDVTVMFCDLRDFTSWAERHDPADVIADLNELLGALAQCVFETDGTLDKYTGDGLMAFWGAPVAQPDHAERAVRAALRFGDALREHNERRAADGESPFAIGVGIHSGRAIVGNVGHEDRHDYTAIGDTVNVAARLEAASKQLGAPIVISGDTHARLPRELCAEARDAGEVQVKGRVAALRVHVLGGNAGEAVA